MKNVLKKLKFFGFITLISAIVLSLAACSSPTGGDNNDNNNGEPNNLGITWTGIAGGTGTGPNPPTPGASEFGTNQIQGIAYGGGRYVAVGYQGRMAYSTDGLSWTGIAGGSQNIAAPANPGDSEFGTNEIWGIAYGDNKFVAVGESGRIAYSADGTSWTGIAGGTGDGTSDFGLGRILGITYGGNKFVGVGAGGRMVYSTDGTSWTSIAGGTGATAEPTDPGDSGFGQNQINGIAYGGGRFVAVGGNGRMAYSTDGISWTGIAGGDGTGANPGTPGASGFGTNSIQNIAYGSGRFVAVGQNGRMAYSPGN
ncbi:MAG: hypothetical protein FWH12_04880 [Treponema sp.]|nr:hypothetical protein [Treponema sp.]